MNLTGAKCSYIVEHPLTVRWVIRSIPHRGPIQLFLVSAMLYDWYNKGCGMCYPVCGMVHITDSFLLIKKLVPIVAAVGFPSHYLIGSFTMCFAPYNRKIKYVNRKERNVLFSDALNTIDLWLHGVRHMVEDNSDSERGNPLLLLQDHFSNNSKESFIIIYTISQTWILLHQLWSTSLNDNTL